MRQKCSPADRHGYEDLANAVVIMAARDYRVACRRYNRGRTEAEKTIKQIEKFFNSEYGDLLCHGKAKDILLRLQAERGASEVAERMAKPKKNEIKPTGSEKQCHSCKYIWLCNLDKQAFYKITGRECPEYKEEKRR